jgi:hypothetical protein
MIEELREWNNARSSEDPNLVVFSDGDPEAHKELQLQAPIIMDKDYVVAAELGMMGTPSAVLINEKGEIVTETGVGAANIWALIGKTPPNVNS